MEQDQYVKVNIKESVRSQLKEQAKGAGKTLADYIEWLAGQKLDTKDLAAEADALLEQLDTQSSDPYAQYRNLDEDELPECCQGIFSGLAKDRCEHWEWVNGGWRNKITNRYANDEKYYHYI